MNAIIDPGQTVTVKLSDVTSEDPDPTTELQFSPSTLKFTRVNDFQHRSLEQEVKVTAQKKKKKTTTTPSLDVAITSPLDHVIEGPLVGDGDGDNKAKVLQADDKDDDDGAPTIKKKVTMPITHTTIITMFRAGKGDSYILSDQNGKANDWAHALIDGGPLLGFAKIGLAMEELKITKFNMINCTHYDDDHIGGGSSPY